MYEEFFGLRKAPFRMTPDPSTICLMVRHREALAGLSYAILRQKGFTVLTGDAGTGKTTLISRVIHALPRDKVTFSVILNSALTPAEFLESVLIDFGFQDIPASKAVRIQQLQRFLLREYEQGRQCVLIVDEAQDLSAEVLEEIRLLSNCELPERKLLQVVLCGQSELEELLDHHSLRQLKQRVEVRLRLVPLTEEEVCEYIRFRWRMAGGLDPLPFEPPAIAAINEYSGGIPRLVNAICDSALIAAFGAGRRAVSPAHVGEIARDLGLDRRRVGVESRDAGSLPEVKPAPAPEALRDAPAAPLPSAPPVPPFLLALERRETPPRTRSRISRWVAKLHFAETPEAL